MLKHVSIRVHPDLLAKVNRVFEACLKNRSGNVTMSGVLRQLILDGLKVKNVRQIIGKYPSWGRRTVGIRLDDDTLVEVNQIRLSLLAEDEDGTHHYLVKRSSVLCALIERGIECKKWPWKDF